MTRTLVISDLHIGGLRPTSLSVLEAPAPLERLLDALEGCDRLVLLGDIVELHGRPQAVGQALETAEPILRAIGARLGREREVVIVPGNHDTALVRRWSLARADRMSNATALPLDATPALERVAAMLSGTRVRARYPGVWLGDRVWATHGHYLDPHLRPVSAYGIARREVRRATFQRASVREYELAAGPQAGSAGYRLRAPLLALLRPWLAPVIAAGLDLQMRHEALPAFAHVVRRLGVEADWVVFGHVHRLGPLPDDAPGDWQGAGTAVRMANTGSWIHEPLLVGHSGPRNPYWPGGAITVSGSGEVAAAALLSDVPRAELTSPCR